MIPFFIDTRVLPNLISRKLCLRNSSRGSSSSNELHLTTGEHSSQYLLASAHLWRHSTNDPRLSAGAVRRAIPATIISVALHSIVQTIQDSCSVSIFCCDIDSWRFTYGGYIATLCAAMKQTKELTIYGRSVHIVEYSTDRYISVYSFWTDTEHRQRSSVLLVRRSLAAWLIPATHWMARLGRSLEINDWRNGSPIIQLFTKFRICFPSAAYSWYASCSVGRRLKVFLR